MLAGMEPKSPSRPMRLFLRGLDRVRLLKDSRRRWENMSVHRVVVCMVVAEGVERRSVEQAEIDIRDKQRNSTEIGSR